MSTAAEALETANVLPHDLDAIISSSTAAMREALLGHHSGRPHLVNASPFDRLLNGLILKDAMRTLNSAGYSLENISTLNLRELEHLASVLEDSQAKLSPARYLAWVAMKVQKVRYGNGITIESDGSHCVVVKYSEDCAEGMREREKKYGHELFTPAVVARASYNVMAMRLFAQANGKPCPPNDAMYALALLHPLTDDCFDKGTADRQTVSGITRKLQGMDVPARNRSEAAIYGLVNDMYAAYPASEHPTLVHILQRLHGAQIKAEEQKNPAIADERIVDLSFEKGGLSLLAMGYIAFGGLTWKEAAFFYEGGTVFQLIDDLNDLAEDMADGVNTLWTRASMQGKPLDEPFNAMLHLQNAVTARLPENTAGFANQTLANRIYTGGFTALAMAGYFANEQRFTPGFREDMAGKVPLNYNLLRQLALKTGSSMREGFAFMNASGATA